MLIRELKKSDINRLIELIIDYKKESNQKLSADKTEKIRELFTALINKEDSIPLVCEIDNTVQGYINAHILNFPLLTGKECYVSDLLINREVRGKGIGNRLIENLKVEAKKKECIRLMLNNPKEAKSYKTSFYSKKGFIERSNFANFVLNL